MNSMVCGKVISAEEFMRKMKDLANHVVDLAQDYVFSLDARPELRKDLLDAGVPRDFLRRLEKVGRGVMSRRLVLESGRWVEKVARLPLSEQEEALNDGVDVLCEDGMDHRRISVCELSPKQMQQVFGDDGLRTLAEQRTWMEEQEQDRVRCAPMKLPELVWKVRGNRVVIGSPCELTRQQMLMILAEMEG
jgi:hypothetical protein